jgi:hypothetical protein
MAVLFEPGKEYAYTQGYGATCSNRDTRRPCWFCYGDEKAFLISDC